MTALAVLKAPNIVTGLNVVRGTVPIPNGWDESKPLCIVDEGGRKWPTQAQSVKPHQTSERVLELIALVEAARTSYLASFTVEESRPPNAIGISDAPELRLWSEGYGGKLHAATLAPAWGYRGGPVMRTLRAAGELHYPGSTVRFLGYDAYLTTVTGQPGVVIVDMLIQNACVEAPISPDLYFKSINLQVPAGWSVMHQIEQPFQVGAALMAPNPDGRLHVMPQGQSKVYRFAVHTSAAANFARNMLDYTGLFVCAHSTRLWSWGNPKTAFYTPQAIPMPDLSFTTPNIWNAQPYGASYAQIAGAMEQGLPLVQADMYGPAGPYYPRGVTDGGTTGGIGIWAIPGIPLLHTGDSGILGSYMAMNAMSWDRSRGVAAVDASQTPVRVDDFNCSQIQYVTCGKLNVNHEGPWPRSKAISLNVPDSVKPLYQGKLMSFAPYDFAHMGRGLEGAITLAFLVNDPIARTQLASYQLWSRLFVLEYGGGQLADANNKSSQYPGKGGCGGREHGWAQVAIVADSMLSGNPSNIEPWLDMYGDMRERAQLPSGGWQANEWGKPADTINALVAGQGLPRLAAGQAIEFGLDLMGARAVQVRRPDTAWPGIIKRAVQGLRDYHWKIGTDAPHTTLPVRWVDIRQPAFANKAQAPSGAFTSSTDNYQTWVVPTYALLADRNDSAAWTVMERLYGVPRDQMLAKAKSMVPNKLDNNAGLLALLQLDAAGIDWNSQAAPSTGVTAAIRRALAKLRGRD